MGTIQESGDTDNAPHTRDARADTSDEVVLVLTTWPDATEADAAARAIVEQRLAACITQLPRHHATYRWDGRVETADEYQWVIKTTRGRLPALWDAVRGAHPYDTPEWLVLATFGGSEAYLQWLRASTSDAPDAD